MTKKKSFISLLLTFCLIIPAMFMLTACGGNNTQTLKSDDGIAVVGEFEKGAELKTDKVEVSSDDANTILAKLESGNIVIKSKDNAMIYDIFVSKDDKKVQPNGKVAVSVPVTESASGYKVFHIKGDNTIEELSATYKDGILTFETSSFSYFVIIPTGDVTINIPTPDTGDDTPTAGSEAEWNKAIDDWKKATNVKVVSKYVSSQSYDEAYGNMGADFRIYQFDKNKNAYSEDGYLENAKETWDYVGKGFYQVKEGDKYSQYESCDEGDTWHKVSIYSVTYEGSLTCKIYGWRVASGMDDGEFTNVVDFNYENFEYDSTSGEYKSKDGKDIIVKFEFDEDGTLIKIVASIHETEYDSTETRTITFGDAKVNVPTSNIEDHTISE